MKRILCLIICIMMLLTMVSCSRKTGIKEPENNKKSGQAGTTTGKPAVKTDVKPKKSDYGQQLLDMLYEMVNDAKNLPLSSDNVLLGIDMLYKKGENVLISDLSLKMCLAMVAEGAQGDTLKELETYLGCSVEEYRKFAADYLKDLPDNAKKDMLVSLITLKYTQSNSVCFVKDGQAIGVGAGQQSRVHCVRLAAQKADNWLLRQCPKVLNLPFRTDIKRAERDNAIDNYIGEYYMDVLADGEWEKVFTEKPAVFTDEEKREWLDQMEGVTLGSDAFFPFSDSIDRGAKSGVKYVVQPGGSIRDDLVIDACNKYGMVMVCNGVRLFHH